MRIDKTAIIEQLLEAWKKKETISRIVEAYFNDTHYLKTNIYQREVVVPQEILEDLLAGNFKIPKLDLTSHDLDPLGEVAVVLPRNGIGMLIAKSVISAFIGGNQVLVKFPRKLTHSYLVYKELIEGIVPDVRFEPLSTSSEHFLVQSFKNPNIKAIIIYGDDKWIPRYTDLARETKTKMIFEGPGNDPQVVFPNADLELATDDAIKCGLNNGGQSCSAFERFFVHSSIHEAYVHLLTQKLSDLPIGAPDLLDSKISVIGSSLILNRLKDQVEDAIQKGGKVHIGGYTQPIPNLHGEAFMPTVITNCSIDMKLVQEESFGPVFPIIKFNDDVDQLIDQLNETQYGLNASIYGTSPEQVNEYLKNSHRVCYHNSCAVSPNNRTARIVEGGYKNSGFIWEWKANKFQTREGRRYIIDEVTY